MAWELAYSRQAVKDTRQLLTAGLKTMAQVLLDVLARDPFQNPSPYEKLSGEVTGFYSRRINIQRRLVYEVLKEKKIVGVLRMWAHYE